MKTVIKKVYFKDIEKRIPQSNHFEGKILFWGILTSRIKDNGDFCVWFFCAVYLRGTGEKIVSEFLDFK